MKKSVGIGFLVAFSLFLMSPAMMIGWFHLDQAAIAANHCVNQNQPELECKGRCYLTAQLAQNLPTDPLEDETALPIEVLVIPFFDSHSEIKVMSPDTIQINGVELRVIAHSAHLFRLFRPPRTTG